VSFNIDWREAVRLTCDMVRIPSVNPPGEEGELARYIEGELRAIGLETHSYECRPGRPNVVGWLRGEAGRPRLMLNGHLDVVPVGDRSLWTVDPFGGVVRDGRIYGRGSNDMKGGIASMILAAKALKESEVSLKGDLLLTAVVDEEEGGVGASDLVDRGYTADMAVVAEPTGLRPIRAHKGLVWFEVKTIGRAAHSSRVSSKRGEGGVNAIYKMAKLIEAFQEYLGVLEGRQDSLVGNPTVSVGTIEGGFKTNIVPDVCRITVDRRLLPSEDPGEAEAELESIIQRLGDEDPDFKAELKVLMSRRGAETRPNEAVVKISEEAVEDVLGGRVEAAGCPATSDMEVFVNKAGIPTVILGPGSISGAHVVDEYIDVDQIVSAAKIYTSIALRALL